MPLLYKFRPIDLFALDILIRERLFLAPLGTLNDAHEALMFVEGPEGSIINYQGNPQRLSEIDPNMFEALPSAIRITCLSMTWSSNLLWGHYADGQRGIAIGLKLPPGFSSQRVEVEYNDKIPTLKLPLTNEDIQVALSRKSSDWSVEKEVRLVSFKEGDRFIEDVDIKEVIFGQRVSQDDVDLIMRVLANKSISFWRICNKPGQYLLDRSDVQSRKFD
ncbi:MAG: DUF2971 domain-containing protein [Bdellovibrionales bacterium]|nr:DUF2971 domain-containing protein [Bdellovibrionales bacterium]